MHPLYLSSQDLERLLERGALRAALREALRLQSTGEARSGARQVLPVTNGALGAMLGAAPGHYGGKLVCILPGNHNSGLNPHQGIVALFDSETGQCLCLGDASCITALRTAAASAAATEVLSRQESAILTVVGSGTQAAEHIEALLQVRALKQLRICARNQTAAESLAERFRTRLEISLFTNPAKAARDADILCLCTSASDPYLSLAELPSGIHVNAVGACRPGNREIDLEEGTARIFVDSLAAASAEAEELRTHFEKGTRICEIGAVFAGSPGRQSAEEITLFKSVGIGIEDTAALAMAYRCAQTEMRFQ